MIRSKLMVLCFFIPFFFIGTFFYCLSADIDTASIGKKLHIAYPNHIVDIKDTILLWNDGTRMPIDDGITEKTWHEILNNPDMQDQMSLPYPPSYPNSFAPTKNNDPGRIRYEPFFKKMYGSTQKEVETHLITIKWLPNISNETIRVTTVNNVHKKLIAISDELEKLPPQYHKYITNIGGAYNYRTIKGTNRLSMHSFGIAVDMNVAHSEYWNWDYEDELDDITYRNRMPYVIVKIFEKHGFIWGGKWYHYDTMHFEYRPELLVEMQ